MELPAGTIVDGKFQVFRPFAVGGFGTIYEAKQVNLDRFVALKLLRDDVMLDKPALARFEREAKAMSAIKNRNVCQCYAYGVWQNMPYMALEFIHGENLQTIIFNEGRLHTKRALELAQQLCEGLHSAHKHGLVHRDLKPTNIIVTKVEGEEVAKIIDFGLAKVLPGYGMTVQRLTETGTTMGSVNYMSPEQCTGQQIDGRADVYSVGCILFECLTGEKLFDGEDPVTVMMRHLHDQMPSLTKYKLDGFDANSIEAVVSRAVEKNPEARYQSAEEMAADVQRILNAQAVQTSKASKRSTISYPGMKQPKRFKWMVGVLSAVLFVAIAGGGYLWWRQQPAPPAASTLGGNVYDATHEVERAEDAVSSFMFKEAAEIAQGVLQRERHGQQLLPGQSAAMHAIWGTVLLDRDLFEPAYAEARLALERTDRLTYTLSRLLIRSYEKTHSRASKELIFAGVQKQPCATDPNVALHLYCLAAELCEANHDTKQARHWLSLAAGQKATKTGLLGWYWGSLARCDAFENKRDLATEHFLKALSVSTPEEQPWAVGELMHFLCDWKQFDKTKQLFDIVKSEDGIEPTSKTAQLRAMQAELYAAEGRKEQAAAEMTAVLRLAKTQPDVVARYLVWQPLQAAAGYFGADHSEQKYVTLDREAFSITSNPTDISKVGAVIDRLDNEPPFYKDFDAAVAARAAGNKAATRAFFEKAAKEGSSQLDATRLGDAMVEVARYQKDDGNPRAAVVTMRNAILVREQDAPKQEWPGREEYFSFFKELMILARKG